MYGKIFHSIYDGTLAEDWRALITFQQLIVLCDADGVVDMTPQSISRRTGIPIEHIEAGIAILAAPDPSSRTTTKEGKRILPLNPDRDWGWEIVNHKHYRDLRTAEDRREYMRNYMKEKRSKQKLTKANKSKQLTKLANTNTDTHSNTETDADTKNPVPQAGLYTKEIKDIFDYWKTVLQHPRANLDDKRKALIRKHLKSGYSADDLKSAIVGCSNTPHNMGDNDRGQKYDSIELILRDSGQIDRFMGNSASKPISRTPSGNRLNRNMAAANAFLEDSK